MGGSRLFIAMPALGASSRMLTKNVVVWLGVIRETLAWPLFVHLACSIALSVASGESIEITDTAGSNGLMKYSGRPKEAERKVKDM